MQRVRVQGKGPVVQRKVDELTKFGKGFSEQERNDQGGLIDRIVTVHDSDDNAAAQHAVRDALPGVEVDLSDADMP